MQQKDRGLKGEIRDLNTHRHSQSCKQVIFLLLDIDHVHICLQSVCERVGGAGHGSQYCMTN